jgi:transmembrane sensor
MNSNEEKMRTAIAAQAREWFVANDAGPLDAQNAAALAMWLKTSPVHIEEFLAVSAIARELKEARSDPGYSLEAILARARVEEDTSIKSLWSRVIDAAWIQPPRRWLPVAVTMAGFAVLALGVLLMWNVIRTQHPSASDGIAVLQFATGHGQQLTQRLADNSVLHLNTDSAVSVRYSKGERLVILSSGQAEFEVAHEAQRAFTVHAGSAEVTDLGTKFDVLMEPSSTVVTVVEGRVAVGPKNSGQNGSPLFIEISTNQQIRVAEGQWPATPVTVDAGRTTAWLHQQIVFDHEPLERVATEYNRYTAKPIEIATPALRNLKISGVFATDDPDAFIAFLRSLKGVRVELTEKNIRVSAE